MDLDAQWPIISEALERKAKLHTRYPAARDLVVQIDNLAGPFKYGLQLSKLNLQYKFTTETDAHRFFCTYLPVEARADEDKLRDCRQRTLNALAGESLVGKSQTAVHAFQNLAKSTFINKIMESKAERKPYVAIITGPTGSGKTAFSIGLVTAAIRDFWKNNIVPTRVEYTKHFPSTAKSAAHETLSLLNQAIRRCQLRDLLIWYFFADGYDGRDILTDLADVLLHETLKQNLRALQQKAKECVFDGERCSLAQIAQHWSDTVHYVLDETLTEAILAAIIQKYSISFLVSFDGFDVTKVEDFVISDETMKEIISAQNGPPNTLVVDAVLNILNGALSKAIWASSVGRDCHFVLYLRDTTFKRIRFALRQKAGGEVDFPQYWITPPRYGDMIDKVAALVTNDTQPAVDDLLVTNIKEWIFASLNRITKGLPFDEIGKRRYSVLFNWNARNMKRHFGRILLWSLADKLEDSAFESKFTKGIGHADLWRALISNENIKKMERFQVLEELFLDSTRQLRPRFSASSSSITALLKRGKPTAAVEQLGDYGEQVGFMECIFNYLTKDIVKFEERKGPAVLIMVRICQYIEKTHSADQIRCMSFFKDWVTRVPNRRLPFFCMR
jgi:hypothetical protein